MSSTGRISQNALLCCLLCLSCCYLWFPQIQLCPESEMADADLEPLLSSKPQTTKYVSTSELPEDVEPHNSKSWSITHWDTSHIWCITLRHKSHVMHHTETQVAYDASHWDTSHMMHHTETQVAYDALHWDTSHMMHHTETQVAYDALHWDTSHMMHHTETQVAYDASHWDTSCIWLTFQVTGSENIRITFLEFNLFSPVVQLWDSDHWQTALAIKKSVSLDRTDPMCDQWTLHL